MKIKIRLLAYLKSLGKHAVYFKDRHIDDVITSLSHKCKMGNLFQNKAKALLILI